MPNHAALNDSAGQYVDGDVTTNGIESLWTLFKRAYWGTWHWVYHTHLQAYLNEFTGRLNQRRLSTLEAMGEIVRGMDGKRLTYRDLAG
ncbi:MAG: transposase [Acidobacteriota bacterium]|nr:transposase [Acidobacteriota bacterium]